jgi:decaprenylphospho-beta-D-ribofuranose 2-oxidase
MPVRSLEPSSWAQNDALNIAWQTSRTNGTFRSMTWEMLKGYFAVTRVGYRNRWLREDVNFSAQLDDKRKSTDLLQEYFIPRRNLIEFISKLRFLFIKYDVTILNATLRIVKKQIANNHLPYCEGEDMMCLALDFVSELIPVGEIEGKIIYKPSSKTEKWVSMAIDHVLVYGSYYLPYYNFASRQQFYKAYPKYSYLKIAKNYFDANNKISNEFFNKYLN